MRKSGKKIGILGFGEVGKAIFNVYEGKGFSPAIKDLDRQDPEFADLDVLNISIPFLQNFGEIALLTIKDFVKKDGIVVIHSTVAPGTTRQVGEKLKKNGLLDISLGQSPIRGIHPRLEEGIRTFTKFVGTNNPEAGRKIAQHFSEDLGLTVEIFTPSEATELGKLLDTDYYAVCVAFHGYAKEWCDKYGVNFDDAVTAFNKSYNEGYTKLGKTNVVRPVLYPPQKDGGKIGGHCLVPNAIISAKDKEMGALWDFIKKFS